MKKAIFLILLVLLFSIILAKDNIRIAAVDSMETEIKNSNFSYESQKRLINYYLNAKYYESALLNFSFLKRNNKLTYDDLKQMSEIEYNLGLVDKAVNDLSNLYLYKEDNSIIYKLAICYANLGDSDKSFRLLNRLPQNKDFSFNQLRQQYVELYNLGNQNLANSCRDLLWQFDAVTSSKYFVKPKITIISPEKNLDTNLNKISIVFQVSHPNPIKSVKINNYELYEYQTANQNKSFKQDFSYPAEINEGENTFIIKTTDLYGETQTDTVLINQFSFYRNLAWKSNDSDSLLSSLNKIKSYYSNQNLSASKDKNALLCVIDANSNQKKDILTIYDLLSNEYCGPFEKNNTKLIYENRSVYKNIKGYLENSLLKQINLNTNLLFIISGSWKNENNGWWLKDINGEWINMKPCLNDICKFASSSITIVFNGLHNSSIKNELIDMSNNSINGINLVFTGESVWKENINNKINTRNFKTSTYAENFNLTDLLSAEAYPNKKYNSSLLLINNPFRKIQTLHNETLYRMTAKMKENKVNDSNQNKITDFCYDWRRYEEMQNYLTNKWTVTDLLLRINEYNERNGVE